MSDYLCDHCGGPTVYQTFSGGEEYYCPGCGNQARYDLTKEGLPRATLLTQGEEGAAELRRQLHEALGTRKPYDELSRQEKNVALRKVMTKIEEYGKVKPKEQDDLSQRLWREGARLAWEAEGDADRGWAHAQKLEDECQEWVDSYKSLRDWANAKLSAQEIELNALREDLDAHSGPECMAIASALELAEAEIDRLRRIVKNQEKA